MFVQRRYEVLEPIRKQSSIVIQNQWQRFHAGYPVESTVPGRSCYLNIFACVPFNFTAYCSIELISYVQIHIITYIYIYLHIHNDIQYCDMDTSIYLYIYMKMILSKGFLHVSPMFIFQRSRYCHLPLEFRMNGW